MRHPEHQRHTRRGFSLIEATVSIAITSLLLVGMAGAIQMSIRAADLGIDGNTAAMEGDLAGELIASDLRDATEIQAFSANQIQLIVPDRNRDGRPEDIEYLWDLTPGSPLVRKVNDVQTKIISDVRAIDTFTITRSPPSLVEGAETRLSWCVSPAGSSLATVDVNASDQIMLGIRPELPGNAVSWRVTRLRIFGQRWTLAGTMTATIFNVDGSGRATGSAIASESRTTLSLPVLPGWVEFALPVTALAPGQGVAVVISGSVSGAQFSATVARDGPNLPFDAHYRSSIDAGATWNDPTDTRDLHFELYGHVTRTAEVD